MSPYALHRVLKLQSTVYNLRVSFYDMAVSVVFELSMRFVQLVDHTGG